MKSVYSVTQMNLYIKNMFLKDFVLNHIYIKGEVSNCKYHTSGHIYFTLKDEKGQIACVMFAGQRNGLNFQLKEGQSVVALGAISVYERDGKYQLYASEIVQDGSGQLYQQFENLKKQLESEGIFDSSNKKNIPLYPKKIGIVTASTGAALQDILNISKRRNPYVQLILYPAKVQGDGAAKTVVAGIKTLEAYGVDTIIIGRGGGSIEDLWAFNEEIVARAIYACKIPIISAVGHETDVTISDFAADLRAPTPSAAAELAIPDINEMRKNLESIHYELVRTMEDKLNKYRTKLEQYRLRLEYGSPIYKVRQKRQYLMDLEQRISNDMNQIMQRKKHQFELFVERLEGLSPLKKLKQGYAFVLNEEKQVLNCLDKTSVGDTLSISVTDGEIIAKVEDKIRKERS